jgi:hypothetical protein
MTQQTPSDWIAWANDIAQSYQDVAMIVSFEPASRAAGAVHVGIVMKDGGQAPWFAAGKNLEGVAWSSVPGRGPLPQLLADERLQRPDLRVYLSFCDTRALLFTYAGGAERIAHEDLVDAPYRMLYPDAAERPPLEEFFLHWGEPVREARVSTAE